MPFLNRQAVVIATLTLAHILLAPNSGAVELLDSSNLPPDEQFTFADTFADDDSAFHTYAGCGYCYKLEGVPDHSVLFALPLIGQLRDIGYRVSTSDSNDLDGLTRQALFLDFNLPWTWSGRNGLSASSSLSLELGRFSRSSEDRNFISIGPSIRLTNDNWRKPFFVDLGLSPTVIDGSRYGDKEFGTSFNFTSHVALGMRFGKQKNHSVRLRYEHISNGGLDEVNPGINMIGIDFVLWAR